MQQTYSATRATRASRPAPGVTDEESTVLRYIPDPSEAHPAPKKLPLELTYGCVEWFDYKSHPLETGLRTE